MKKIAMLVGENFWLRIPMNNESAGRHLCMDDVEVIHAWLESGYGGCWTLQVETDGEQLEGVAVKVPGSRLGLGTYAVVMAGKFVNGDHFRTKRQLFIRLVDREDQADAKPTMFNEEKAYWAGPAVLSGMLSRDGLNTYELAVLHGYDGTLEQFLAQAGIELQDLMVTKAKLSREVQTQLDKGSEKAINPAGDYDTEAEYSVNEMVYDEVTNSSYVSKQSVNVGHAVTDTDWWMKVLDGNYVQTTIQAIMTAAQETLNEAKQDTIDATAAALAAKQDTEQATAAANAVVAQKVADAQIGYYECTTAADTATKATTTNTIGQSTFAVPVKGCIVKIKMTNANTATDTVYLQFGSDANTKKELKYNGLAVDASNTWEDGEVISVYYDGTCYQASNAQGGGSSMGKKELKTSVGYVPTNEETIGEPVTETAGARNWRYIRQSVEAGDVVKISGNGGNTGRLWAIGDVGDTIIARAEASASAKDLVLVMPEGAKCIVINSNKDSAIEWYYAKKGSIGAHEILAEAYLYGDIRPLALGNGYDVNEAVQTADGQLLRITKEITSLNLTDTVSIGDLKGYDGNSTYRAKKVIGLYDEETSYANGDYAVKDGVVKLYNGSDWSTVTLANMISDNTMFESVSLEWIIKNATVQETSQNEISIIKDVVGINTEQVKTINPVFAQGNLNNTGGNITDTISLRTAFIKVYGLIRVVCAPGYYIKAVYAYSKSAGTQYFDKILYNGNNSGVFDVTKSEITLTTDKYLRFVFGKTSNGNITVDEKSNFIFYLYKGNSLDTSIVNEVGNIEERLNNPKELDLSLYSTVRALPSPDNWVTNRAYYGIFIPVTPGDSFCIKANDTAALYYGFLKAENVVNNGAPVIYATGCTREALDAGEAAKSIIPSDASTLYISVTVNADDTTPKSVTVAESLDNVLKRLDAVEMDSIDSVYGWFSHVDGAFTAAEGATSSLQRKFIVDPTKKYYANLRMFANTTSTACGVAYFDSDNNFICGQYNQNTASGAKEYLGAALNIPPSAHYAYIIGYDHINLGIYPRLFLANETEQTAHKCIEHEVMTFTLLGKGTTLDDHLHIKVKPNTLYVLKGIPNVWSMPEPTANSSGFGILQLNAQRQTVQDRRIFRQSDFTAAEGIGDGLYFVTNPICSYACVYFRALQNVSVEFTLYEINNSEIVTKGTPTPDTLIYRTAKVRADIYENATGSNSLVSDTIDSAWGAMFPASYSPTGKPTQVIAMFHGGHGFVSPTVLGTDTQAWINWRNAYLNAGFAVMDINGWGISTEMDDYSRHYGCPLAVETVDKAFSELKAKYNVCDKLMLHGSSMGTTMAWCYLLAHPNNVACVGQFAAGCISWLILYNRNIRDAYDVAIHSWQYANAQAAKSDNFQRIVGYDPILKILDYDEVPATFKTNLVDYDVMELASKQNIAGAALPCPIRIWHGTSDETIPYSLSQTIVRAYRNGGNNITLRTCPNLEHEMCVGTTQYVVDEAVEYFLSNKG